MALIANFSQVNSEECDKLILTDTSTANYDGETIVNRSVTMVDAAGANTVVPWPMINGVGDTLEIDITKDMAMTLEMDLTPAVITPGSDYDVIRFVSYICNINRCYRQKMDIYILSKDCKNLLKQPDPQLHELQAIDNLLNAVAMYSSLNDLTGAQEAIDLLNGLCELCECQK
jgi:hypothetical protein